MAIDTKMSATSLVDAKLHVYNVCQTGHTITLVGPGTVDEYGEILTENTRALQVFPIRYKPFPRKVSESISWAKDVDVIFYVAKKQLDDLSLDVIDLDRTYKDVRIASLDYEIKYIDNYSSFFTDHLYVIIGCTK